ncbi:MAG: hypothetical protein JSV03_06660, partial [Planctomycetota bacterium]
RPSHVHDCNGNGVYDHEDITNGTSPDINYNGVPDECETRIYVDDDAAGANDGSSWTDAHNNLQDALAHALSSFETMNSVTEIWVAAGTYKPDGPGGDRFKSFNLLNNLAIYGGFAGTETELEQRNPTSNVSILSGDLNGDDGPDFSNNDENSCHVVTSIFVPSTILDGFTITGGNADGSGATSGGGMYCRQSSPMIANCIFKDNYAWSEGGGIYNYECSPILSNCMFVGNLARGDGGGLHSIRSNATVIKCVFYDNSADDGGAMGNTLSDTTVINCKFQGNSASQRGGAIYNFECNPKFTNCAFVVNSAQSEGGGVCNSSDSNSILTNCTLYGNSAQIRGGGICNYSYNCHPLLTSCILWNNVAGGVSDESAQCGGYAPVANYCCVQGLTGLWGGVGNIGDDPIFVDPDGIDNDPNTWGDNDYHLSDGSPCIDAGDNTSLPPDEADLDGDGNTIEQTPFDLEDNQRFWDDPNTIDSGNPGAPGSPITDMGAYEFISPLHTPGDFNHDGDVDQEDFGIFQACISGSGSLYAPGCADADLDKDSDVDLNDFTIFQSCMAGPNQPSGC